jgi:eukaryotic-like serine/threonine-protein kinase
LPSEDLTDEVRVNHPTDEELRALSGGKLSDEELARVSAHLGDCPGCCRRIDELANDDPLLARLQKTAVRVEEVLVTPAQRGSAVRALLQENASETAEWKRGSAATVVQPAPRQVGEYDVLAEVGRGGMGVVYQARHRSLQRLAALKMVLAGEFASPTQELRFRLEAELAARVRHPNIVQVFEIGSYEGRPFLALEWADGGSLADRLNDKPWPPGEAAALVETLARAIHVAHVEGVIHRDLKPANVLLTSQAGPALGDGDSGALATGLAGWTLKITDFGLAQTIEGGKTLTKTGFLVGTPGYMAPEQAGGKRALVGPATDVYALGVVLYQLLTGQLPFRGDSALDVLRAVTSDDPVRPRRLQPGLSRDLEAVVLHCLEKEPARRYSSALALAEDLQRFREGRQVVARPVGTAARLARACRCRPVIALLLILLATSLFAGIGGVTWKWLEADEQRDRANSNARQAIDEKHAALYQAYRAHIAAAAAALQNHDVADAARQLAAAPEELRGWEWCHLQSRLDDSSAVIPLPAEGTGFLLAGPDGLQIGTSTDAGVYLSDLAGAVPVTFSSGTKRWLQVAGTHTRRGLRLAAWVDNTTFEVLDENGQILCRVPTLRGGDPPPLILSPDGSRLAFPWPDGQWSRLALFDAISGKQTAICEGHRGGIWRHAFSPDGTRLVSGGEDNLARIWDAATGALLTTCRGHVTKVLSAAFSPDGALLVTTSADGTVRQWDAATGQEVEAPYDRHSGEVHAVTYSPDGHWIASGGTDRTVRVWRAKGRQDVAVLGGHTGAVTEVAFAPDGRRLASLSKERGLGWVGDDTVRAWDIDVRATMPVLRGHQSYVYPVAFSPDGRWLASGSWDRTVLLWDAATGEPCASLLHLGVVPSLAYGPDGSWLVSRTLADNRLRIWDVATAQIRKEIQGPAEIFRSVTVSPDGKRLATTVFDEKKRRSNMYVFDLTSGERLFSSEGTTPPCDASEPVAYSPDGRWLAYRDTDYKTVSLLDARTHETVAHFSGHEKFIYKVVFSPDSRILASCSADRTVRLWQIDRGTCQVLRGHTDAIFAAAFHPDGTRLATGGRDGAILLWDLARGEDVARLQGHTSYVWSLAFSPDGATLASGSGDATVRLWDTVPLKVRYQARREAAALRPEATRLVEQLWQQKHNPAEVVEALRADPTLSESLRHAALRAVLQKASPPKTIPEHGQDPP